MICSSALPMTTKRKKPSIIGPTGTLALAFCWEGVAQRKGVCKGREGEKREAHVSRREASGPKCGDRTHYQTLQVRSVAS